MSARDPLLTMAGDPSLPVYRRIAEALAAEIRRGRFRPGDHLPGYRTVAEQLGVSRNSVISAYRELQAEGWVVTRPVVGTVVAAKLPRSAAAASPGARRPGRPGFDLAGATGAESLRGRPGLLDLASGVPDPRLLPGAALARAYRRAVTSRAGAALASSDARGHPRLREQLAGLLASTRGLAARPEEVFVTRGSQMALFLLAQAICPPGSGVAVEALGDRRAWEAFARAGARCHPVPVDGEGLDVEALDRLPVAAGLRAVLVTPQRQYPTLVPLSPARRARLLEVAARRRLAVLEVDQDSEFHFDGPPQRALAADDAGGVVVHVGTLSKLFAPALRLGFAVAPAALVARLRALRGAVDRHGDPALEVAMAELLEDGELRRHLDRVSLAYAARRDALCAALAGQLGGVVEAPPPSGGLAVWARVLRPLDLDAWAARALEGGVAIRPARAFAFDGEARAAFRMGFASQGEPSLAEAASRLRAALPG